MVLQVPGLKRFRAFVEEFKRDFDVLQPQRRPQFVQNFPITFDLDALKDNHYQLEGSSESSCLTNVESLLTTTASITTSSDPVIVDSPQPTIEVNAQKSSAAPASVIVATLASSTSHVSFISQASDDAVEVNAQKSSAAPASVIVATSTSSTSHDSFISQASDDAVEVNAQKNSAAPASVIVASSASSTSHDSGFGVSQARDDAADAVDSYTATVRGATLAVPYLSPPETEEDNKRTETLDVMDRVSDDDCPKHTIYHFHNCQHVFLNAFNANGVKVENAGNNAPQVNYNSPSNSRTSSYHGELCPCQLPRREVVPRIELPPVLPPLSFQESMDTNSLLFPPGILPVGISGPSDDQVNDDDDTNSTPGSKIFKLPDPDSGSRLPPLTINTSGHLNHMSLFLPPFPGASVQNALGNNGSIRDFSWSRPNHPQFSQYPVESPQATTSSSSQDSQDLSSILESELEFVLEKVQKELQSGNFSPRIQDKLRLINALVSESTTETPISARTTSTCDSPSLYSCDSADSRL